MGLVPNSKGPYVFEILLLQYREQEPSHGIVIVGRHAGKADRSCGGHRGYVGQPDEEQVGLFQRADEMGLGLNLSFTT